MILRQINDSGAQPSNHPFPKSQSCSELDDNVSMNLIVTVHDIPEVRIHTCE